MSDTCSNADFAGLQWNELSGGLHPCTGSSDGHVKSRRQQSGSAQASIPSWYPRFRRWAARRARQFSIAVLILTGILVVGACGVMLRRATCLIGLPDVGDPFDVAAFRGFSGSRRPGCLCPVPSGRGQTPPAAGPAHGRQARRSDCRLVPGRSPASRVARGKSRSPGSLSARLLFDRMGWRPHQAMHCGPSLTDLNLGHFVRLAFLDASRLEERGDMTAAWGGYRAILHARAHIIGGERSSIVTSHTTCAGVSSRAWPHGRPTRRPVRR